MIIAVIAFSVGDGVLVIAFITKSFEDKSQVRLHIL
jgi:hypothetical protein